MAALNVFLFLLVLSGISARRRPCENDCDCRMTKGHRCVHRQERNKLVHCSIKPEQGSCFCLRSCVLLDGTMIRKGKVVNRDCNNCTCVIPKYNKATCGSNTCR